VAPAGPAATDFLSADGVLGDVEVVDLSQPITADMAGWRGHEVADVTHEHVDVPHSVPGAEISATRLAMVLHAGTHVDAARHFFPQGKSIDQYELGRFVTRGVAVDVRCGPAHELTADELAAADPGIREGDAVLLYFGFAEKYTEDVYHDHPYLSAEATAYLLERGIGLLGVDVPTPDMPAHRRPKPFPYPVHGPLLSNDVLIVENLGPGLAKVLGRPFLFVMPPITIPGSDASPVVPLALAPRTG